MENIIAIHNRSVAEANKAFAEFMKLAERAMNERARKSPVAYSRCSPAEIEEVTHRTLIDVCAATPFRREDIKLVSGHSFPDIMTSDVYGVEVKSTNKDKWTSTGSSIIESTRCENVERIYMMFGSLGSKPPSFRCRPYQECLSNIAVTHSPRYLIDMSLKQNENIFSKMSIDYDTFRQLGEADKIQKVRDFYIQKAKKERKVEMPWWMGKTTNVNLSFFNDQSAAVKEDLTARTFILFPEIFSKHSAVAYKEIALWLCNHYSLLCYNIRDTFSAGGQVYAIDGMQLNNPCPQVVKRLMESLDKIIILLDNPDYDIIVDIEEYWEAGALRSELFSQWIRTMEYVFSNNPNLKEISIKDIIEKRITRMTYK